MLERKAFAEFVKWRERADHGALLVTGARQVGKTYLVRKFARESYEHVVEINLSESPQAARAFGEARDSRDLLARITAFADAPMVPGKTAIFIDEVQESKETVTAVKYLVEQGDYDYLLSGSLLGVELRDIRSWPVGSLTTVEMFPLDFEEFCWARGLSHSVADVARDALAVREPLDGFIHERLMGLFYDYLVIGGMPAAVRAFRDTDNVQHAHEVLADIANLYRNDIAKYADARMRAVRRIFDLIPAELNSPGKRFTVKDIEGTPRMSRYEEDFLWLADAGVALPCYNVSEPRYPLLLNMESRKFKLYSSDVGMLAAQCGMVVVRSLMADRSDMNYGAMYENFVAQQLAAHGRPLFYFANRSIGELDFLVEDDGARIVPVEVKSGKTYKRHSALSRALSTPNYGIEQAIVLHDGNVEEQEEVLYAPIYLATFL